VLRTFESRFDVLDTDEEQKGVNTALQDVVALGDKASTARRQGGLGGSLHDGEAGRLSEHGRFRSVL